MELIVDIYKKLPGFTLETNLVSGSEALGLMGASGSGKSMTLRCIAGLEKPDKGRIVLNGNILFDSEKGINLPCQKRKIGFLFQNYALFPNMTVEENIGFALDKISKERKNRIVSEMIDIVKLGGLEKRYPSQLSGGQQQRTALARAIAIEPEALLLDEPLSALDDHLRSHMIKQLVDVLSNYRGITVFVTHNMEEAYRLCEKLIIISNGQVEAQGFKEELLKYPPTMESARLTGCKNFSAARFVSSHELYASDWEVALTTKKELSENMGNVGIRAHYIRPAFENDTVNVFNCWPSSTSETPFRMTVYLTIGRKPSDSEDYHLQWELPKEQWTYIKDNPLPWRICLDPERLMPFP